MSLSVPSCSLVIVYLLFRIYNGIILNQSYLSAFFLRLWQPIVRFCSVSICAAAINNLLECCSCLILVTLINRDIIFHKYIKRLIIKVRTQFRFHPFPLLSYTSLPASTLFPNSSLSALCYHKKAEKFTRVYQI